MLGGRVLVRCPGAAAPLVHPSRALARCLPCAQPPPGRHLVSAGLLQSIGIFALSCSAHTTLPALRRCAELLRGSGWAGGQAGVAMQGSGVPHLRSADRKACSSVSLCHAHVPSCVQCDAQALAVPSSPVDLLLCHAGMLLEPGGRRVLVRRTGRRERRTAV